MPRNVTEIPAALSPDFHKKPGKTLRVAAYCRVSTEEEEQQNSFEVQVRYYTEKISSNEGCRDFRRRRHFRGADQKPGSVQRDDHAVPPAENRPDFDQVHLPVRPEHPGLHPARPPAEKLGNPRNFREGVH